MLSRAGLLDIVRLASPQRCSPARNGRFARPCGRSAYTYTPSGRSPARLVSFSQVPPRWRRRSKPRLAPLVEFGAVLAVSASLPLHAPPLPLSSRRYAPQCFVGGYASSPCAVSRCASDEPRRCMSLSSALDPSSLPHLPLWRVSFRSPCARRLIAGSLNFIRQRGQPLPIHRRSWCKTSFHPPHRFNNFSCDRLCKWRRNRIADLPVFVTS